MNKINGFNVLETDIVFLSNIREKDLKELSLIINKQFRGRKINFINLSINDFNIELLKNKDNFYLIQVNINKITDNEINNLSNIVKKTNNHNFLVIIYTKEKEFKPDILDFYKNNFTIPLGIVTEYKKDSETFIYSYEVKYTPINKRGTSDYQYLIGKGASKEYREKMNIGDIWINGAVCLKCNDFIRSKNVHDFKHCKCGNIFVDGGSFYARRGFNEPNSYIDVIEMFE